MFGGFEFFRLKVPQSPLYVYVFVDLDARRLFVSLTYIVMAFLGTSPFLHDVINMQCP